MNNSLIGIHIAESLYNEVPHRELDEELFKEAMESPLISYDKETRTWSLTQLGMCFCAQNIKRYPEVIEAVNTVVDDFTVNGVITEPQSLKEALTSAMMNHANE